MTEENKRQKLFLAYSDRQGNLEEIEMALRYGKNLIERKLICAKSIEQGLKYLKEALEGGFSVDAVVSDSKSGDHALGRLDELKKYGVEELHILTSNLRDHGPELERRYNPTSIIKKGDGFGPYKNIQVTRT